MFARNKTLESASISHFSVLSNMKMPEMGRKPVLPRETLLLEVQDEAYEKSAGIPTAGRVLLSSTSRAPTMLASKTFDVNWSRDLRTLQAKTVASTTFPPFNGNRSNAGDVLPNSRESIAIVS